ncbi:hypothetical protein CXG81DRAFT_10019 [Caulochytrium protostelioides]|uniref:WD40 repeat-like protein n=1 Tax=Caulochytrium protostelioides TaxID=1555241 RepID=A0A4P9XCE1_9FUNG|nr:hypothetical protein CXG81DRAFT_10019 [Caulochytrium protostelioides]|eukprot:RKP03096.1 hypothetical protein CXG81DRAFT_10019 [Caulochytrium protostelioides]
MSLEYKGFVREIHARTVTAIQYNSSRRELYTAGEDGLIRIWDLIAWNANGKLLHRMRTGHPIYALTFNSRRQHIMAGGNGRVSLWQIVTMDDPTPVHLSVSLGDVARIVTAPVVDTEHTDLVTCLVSAEGRFYSAGYDGKLLIYDSTSHSQLRLRTALVIRHAHHAAISALAYAKDSDNGWLITGSFDRTVKLWSLDGNSLQKFSNFSDTITSIVYIHPTQTMWVAAGSTSPIVYDPRSDTEITDFVSTDAERAQRHTENAPLRFYYYIPEIKEVVGITTRRSLVQWKYNPCAPISVLSGGQAVTAVAWTQKDPILFFSGNTDGKIRKWERLQLNLFMYSQESFLLSLPLDATAADTAATGAVGAGGAVGGTKIKGVPRVIKPRRVVRQRPEDELLSQSRELMMMSREGTRTYRRKRGQMLLSKLGGAAGDVNMKKQATVPTAVVTAIAYYEPLDMLVAAYETRQIALWEYNEARGRDSARSPIGRDDPLARPPPLSSSSSRPEGVDSNQVAGLSLKTTLDGHRDVIHVVRPFQDPASGQHVAYSSGADRRLMVWDLTRHTLLDTLRGKDGREELAADDAVTDLAVAPEEGLFAYGSEDRVCYVRRLSTVGTEMTLVGMCIGHEAELSSVRWNPFTSQWITGSFDCTFRVWAKDGSRCVAVVDNHHPVTCLLVDQHNGAVVTGSTDKTIRVYDGVDLSPAQRHVGHTEDITDLIHITTRGQYVSAAADGTLRIWKAYADASGAHAPSRFKASRVGSVMGPQAHGIGLAGSTSSVANVGALAPPPAAAASTIGPSEGSYTSHYDAIGQPKRPVESPQPSPEAMRAQLRQETTQGMDELARAVAQ